jgi:hypothetical protein
MEKKPIISDTMREQLRAPFPPEAYRQHPTKTFLTTLKAMYVTERLNDVFGVGRWTIEVEIIERTQDYVLVQGEFHALDYDVAVPKQFGGHQTTGKNVEIADGFKSALTDCQSKIASYLEIGIDMFKGLIVCNGNNVRTPQPAKKSVVKEADKANAGELNLDLPPEVIDSIKRAVFSCETLDELKNMWENNKAYQKETWFMNLKNDRKIEIINKSKGK